MEHEEIRSEEDPKDPNLSEEGTMDQPTSSPQADEGGEAKGSER